MATAIKLQSEIDPLLNLVYLRNDEAEIHRFKEYHAAVAVQAWYRGSKVRRYLHLLNTLALKVQRAWRGFLGRRRVRTMLAESVYHLRLANYNKKATLIQKMWKGYATRKYVCDIHSRKRYLESICEKNQMIREELAEYEENIKLEKLKEREIFINKEKEKWAEKHHHLISTAVQPGVYNSPFSLRPNSQELALVSIKPLLAQKSLNESRLLRRLEHTDKTENNVGYNYDPAWTNCGTEKVSRLPPLPAHKPQGPFRDPLEVREQRYRPLNPSLRVMTDFESLQKARQMMRDAEWVGRLHDDKFLPIRNHDKPYDSMLHTTGQYGHLAYGSKYFRDTTSAENIFDNDFKTVVPPIHVFDKVNKEYVEGYVEV